METVLLQLLLLLLLLLLLPLLLPLPPLWLQTVSYASRVFSVLAAMRRSAGSFRIH